LIEYRIDRRSGIATYQQIVQQTKQALRLGLLQPGDKLPTAREVVEATAINPNTVLKAYRELEHEGLAAARPGVGTFITRALADHDLLAAHEPLRRELRDWLARADRAGLDTDDVEALFMTTVRSWKGRETRSPPPSPAPPTSTSKTWSWPT